MRITSIIGLISLSQLAYTSDITDTYVTGDTLTAAKMNNIKAAVNSKQDQLDFGTLLSVVKVTADTPDQATMATAPCPADSFATGGGCGVTTTATTTGVMLKVDEPTTAGGSPTGWTCTCQTTTGETCTPTATAICTAP